MESRRPEVCTATKIITKLEVMAAVCTTGFSSGLNHSASNNANAMFILKLVMCNLTHEHPGEVDDDEASAEHEQHDQDAEDPVQHGFVQKVILERH